uniref:Uncharacterized protein n=1 Tax=Astyanax mexicanus TaxID=7994 RepID=A0A8B9HGY1_ASTMX
MVHLTEVLSSSKRGSVENTGGHVVFPHGISTKTSIGGLSSKRGVHRNRDWIIGTFFNEKLSAMAYCNLAAKHFLETSTACHISRLANPECSEAFTGIHAAPPVT